MTDPTCIILIPMHRACPTADERISISRTLSVLQDYPVRFVCPDRIDKVQGYEQVEVEHFDDAFFGSVADYNRLMMTAAFYTRFADYTYVLICQPDVFVFRDDLQQWCNRGYDYVGAPWLIKRKYKGIGRIVLYLRALPHLLKGRPFMPLHFGNKVGNGGFSLRRVASFQSECRTHEEEMNTWVERSLTMPEYNEDCYWSCREGWFYPSAEEALHFSIDLGPKDAMAQLNGGLPMGCHAWSKPRYRAYWWPIISPFIEEK